jgi:hypothetical protein
MYNLRLLDELEVNAVIILLLKYLPDLQLMNVPAGKRFDWVRW